MEHGQAHTQDHARWSRRDFLAALGLAAAGQSLVLQGLPVQAYGQTQASPLADLTTDRVLVLLQLSGGNDGLNTVIPVEDDEYYRMRPSIAIPKANTLALTDEVGLHPSLGALEGLYGDGRMALLQNVGYPDPNLSHFRSTDIWMSASNADEVLRTGWAGRFLGTEFPDLDDNPSSYPLAVQLGGGGRLLFQAEDSSLSMTIANVDLFERLAEGDALFDVAAVPPTPYGAEMAFVRSVANDSFLFAEAIQEASGRGSNDIDYPNTGLSNSLAVLARLIKGQLGTHIYHVTLGGFDTHANQAGLHQALLRELAEAVAAFYEDLGPDWSERVLTMTFSEFGRRPFENGSRGTDHGAAAPLFVFGGQVQGGLLGSVPRLDEASLAASGGNVGYEFDFRAVYATILERWFEMEPDAVATVLGLDYAPLPFLAPPSPVATQPLDLPASFVLAQNYPNPFNPQTTLTYRLLRGGPVRLQVYDAQGRLLQTLVDGTQGPGAYTVPFDARHLPSGTYLYRLQSGEATQTRTMTLIR